MEAIDEIKEPDDGPVDAEEFPEKQKRSSKNDHTFGFLQTWKYFDIDTQILAEHSLADILFQHGFPFSIKRKSFIFHFENIKTLFLPIGLDWENENLSENKHIPGRNIQLPTFVFFFHNTKGT